jgi:hypothetical protein
MDTVAVKRGCAMQNEQHQSENTEFDFAQVWRTAQYRRADDVGPWLERLLEKTRAWILTATVARRPSPRQKARSPAVV